MPLHDLSDQESPIRVSGQVSFQDDPSQLSKYNYRLEGSIENVSSRDVVFAVIHVEVRGVNLYGLNGNLSSNDHFFDPKDLQPGEVENIISRSLWLGESETVGRRIKNKPLQDDWQLVPQDIGSDKTPSSTARVTFVQFADGSAWGDTKAGHAVLAGRSETFQELTRYERALDGEGVAAFLHAFWNRDTDVAFPLIYVLLAKCKGKPDSCVIDGLHSMVQAARRHQAEMQEKWTVSDVQLGQPR